MHLKEIKGALNEWEAIEFEFEMTFFGRIVMAADDGGRIGKGEEWS